MGSFLKDIKKAVNTGKKIQKSLNKSDSKKPKPVKTQSGNEGESFSASTIIVGSNYLENKKPIESLKDGDSVFFVLEPTNEFDKNAIMIVNGKKEKLGYVPKGDQKEISKIMNLDYEAEIEDVDDLSVWVDSDS